VGYNHPDRLIAICLWRPIAGEGIKIEMHYSRWFVVVGRHGDGKLVELRRDPRGEEKRSLKLMRKRTTTAGSGGSGASRDGSRRVTGVRQMVGQLQYENEEFRELLAKVFRQLCCKTLLYRSRLTWAQMLWPKCRGLWQTANYAYCISL